MSLVEEIADGLVGRGRLDIRSATDIGEGVHGDAEVASQYGILLEKTVKAQHTC